MRRTERARQRLYEQLKLQGIQSDVVLEAMFNTPRHLFVDEALYSRAYDAVSLPIGFGQTISQPLTVARMTELALSNDASNKVLEIGTGCGYQAAVLHNAGFEVYSIELLGALLQQAKNNLQQAKILNIHLIQGDGYLGLPSAAPFGAIVVSAAAPFVPEPLLDQLAENGKLIIPIGEETQELWVFERKNGQITPHNLGKVKFVPLVSQKDAFNPN